ncbi:TRAP transporter small permease subunit [Spartinivicinus poritis]|uniref:TRAP transporter small permease protein n=1 Tax=Spartinivicinus poritis TaxID=2994640 RepID=A0ABT5U5N6_9GAMM|nr:TRAP transporter small permease subunit [Spartinivicinus sp. A2-2]MDE1461676.1 TRAP transporter small permease subunit [Spartinivicinus sp. A2-2]
MSIKKITNVVAIIDRITEAIGNFTAWFNLLLMAIVFVVVVLRYGFGFGSIAFQESAIYVHSFIFLVACGYTLKHNGHVRVDIFYCHFKPKTQALVNCFGSLFLLIPVVLFIGWMSWTFVTESWRIYEGSSQAGGLPGVFILKSFILALVATLLLQGIGEFLRAILIIKNQETPPNESVNEGAA